VDPRVAPDPLGVDDRPLVSAEPVRAALVTSLGFGHVSAVVALAHPDVFAAAIAPERRAAYLAQAHQRQVVGARQRLAAQHDGAPVLARRTDRRLGRGTAQALRDREARLLLDPDGTLGPGGSSSGARESGAQQSAVRPSGVVPSGSAGPGVPSHIAPRSGGPAAGEATR